MIFQKVCMQESTEAIAIQIIKAQHLIKLTVNLALNDSEHKKNSLRHFLG